MPCLVGAGQKEKHHGCHKPRHRRCRKGEGGSRSHEEATERWTNELIRSKLDRVEPPVRSWEQSAIDHLRQDRLRRRVIEGLGDPQQERDHVEQPDVRDAQSNRDGNQRYQGRSPEVCAEHHQTPVIPVGDRPSLKSEDQPRQASRYRQTSDECWALGVADRDEREAHLKNAVRQVRQPSRCPEPPVVATERSRLVGLSSHGSRNQRT